MIYGSEILRKYGMVSAVVLLATMGSANAASMGAYSEALASGNAKDSAVEAMLLIEDKVDASADTVMKTSEQLMTSAVATGDQNVVKWVAAGVLKGAGQKNFNAAELGVRVALEGTAYQQNVAQIAEQARVELGVAKPAGSSDMADSSALAEATTEKKSFLANLFDINRSSWSVSNRFSVGYDSNLYSSPDEKSGMVYRDAVNMSLTASSERTALQVFYKPTFTYSPNKSHGDFEVYQDFIGQLSHELSDRHVLRVKDTYRFREDEDVINSGDADDSYWKNNFDVSLDTAVSDQSRLTFGVGSEIKRYTDDDTGVDKDYDMWTFSGAYSQELTEKTFAMLNLKYSKQDFTDSRIKDGTDITTASGGVNHQLNKDLALEVYAGAQYVQSKFTNSKYDDNKWVPYFDSKLTYMFSPRTSVSGFATYSYNPGTTLDSATGSESLRYGLSAKHNMTAKLSFNVSATRSQETYDKAYNQGVRDDNNYTEYASKATYKLNRSNSLDLGYKFRRSTNSETEKYDRHNVEAGWTVKF